MYQELQPVKLNYLIVEFPEEVTEDQSMPMAIISSSWVIENDKNLVCYWPAYIKSTTKRDKAVINHEALQTDKCALCPICVKFSSDNYDVVIAKLKAMEDAQDSQTESELENNNRPYKSNKYSDYAYSSDENEDISIPPKPPQPPKPAKLMIKAKDSPQLVEKKQDQINQSSSFFQKKQTNTTSTNVSLYSGLSCKNSFLHYQKSNLRDTPPPVKSKVDDPPGMGSSGSSLASVAISTDEGSCRVCKSNEAVMQELIKTVEKLGEDIKFLIQLNQDKESQFIGTYENKSFNTVEELLKFDNDLENDDYFQKTSIRLSLVGGRDGATATRKILAIIISHSLALNLNWSGRNNKQGLKDYNLIIKCITAAVRRNPNLRSFTNDEVQGAIKSWLRNATDRDGGRSKRTNKALDG